MLLITRKAGDKHHMRLHREREREKEKERERPRTCSRIHQWHCKRETRSRFRTRLQPVATSFYFVLTSMFGAHGFVLVGHKIKIIIINDNNNNFDVLLTVKMQHAYSSVLQEAKTD